MNSSGKEQLMLKLADMIEKLVNKKSRSNIQLPGKEYGLSSDNFNSDQILETGGYTPQVANQAAEDELMVNIPQSSDSTRMDDSIQSDSTQIGDTRILYSRN
jgi:hypothetical protein